MSMLNLLMSFNAPRIVTPNRKSIIRQLFPEYSGAAGGGGCGGGAVPVVLVQNSRTLNSIGCRKDLRALKALIFAAFQQGNRFGLRMLMDSQVCVVKRRGQRNNLNTHLQFRELINRYV